MIDLHIITVQSTIITLEVPEVISLPIVDQSENPANIDRLTLLQALVGGYILVMPLNSLTSLVYHEEAKIYGANRNSLATRMAVEAGAISESEVLWISGQCVIIPPDFLT